MVEKIGILLVHGIGKQGRFEHIDEVARNFIMSLAPSNEISVNVKNSMLGEFKSKQQTWSKGKDGTVIVSVCCHNSEKKYELHFREVWWSYLGEPTNLKSVFNFWRWGISFWMDPFPREKNNHIEKDPSKPDESEPISIEPKDRWELFVVCILVTGLMPALALIKKVLEILGIDLPLDIISQYLSKVKLFQQEGRDSKEPITNIGEIPRVSIKREMISELVEMASGSYDRWYILAHSLGSVVAYNGLFENENILARYLDEKLWHKACRKHLNKKTNETSSSEIINAQIPTCRSWLKEDDAIDRNKLFSNLHGFLTYGSPLKKYAILWPWLVKGINTPNTFQDKFEWINVYDPLDPVSSSTDLFSEKTVSITPQNFAVKTDGWHLDCHLKYFHSHDNALTKIVADWMLNDTRFQMSSFKNKDLFLNDDEKKNRDKMRERRTGYVFWFFPLVLVFFSMFSEIFIGIVEGHPLDIILGIMRPGNWLGHFEYYLLYIVVIPLLVLVAGLTNKFGENV
jgi:hypothetical protein